MPVNNNQTEVNLVIKGTTDKNSIKQATDQASQIITGNLVNKSALMNQFQDTLSDMVKSYNKKFKKKINNEKEYIDQEKALFGIQSMIEQIRTIDPNVTLNFDFEFNGKKIAKNTQDAFGEISKIVTSQVNQLQKQIKVKTTKTPIQAIADDFGQDAINKTAEILAAEIQRGSDSMKALSKEASKLKKDSEEYEKKILEIEKIYDETAAKSAQLLSVRNKNETNKTYNFEIFKSDKKAINSITKPLQSALSQIKADGIEIAAQTGDDIFKTLQDHLFGVGTSPRKNTSSRITSIQNSLYTQMLTIMNSELNGKISNGIDGFIGFNGNLFDETAQREALNRAKKQLNDIRKEINELRPEFESVGTKTLSGYFSTQVSREGEVTQLVDKLIEYKNLRNQIVDNYEALQMPFKNGDLGTGESNFFNQVNYAFNAIQENINSNNKAFDVCKTQINKIQTDISENLLPQISNVKLDAIQGDPQKLLDVINIYDQILDKINQLDQIQNNGQAKINSSVLNDISDKVNKAEIIKNRNAVIDLMEQNGFKVQTSGSLLSTTLTVNHRIENVKELARATDSSGDGSGGGSGNGGSGDGNGDGNGSGGGYKVDLTPVTNALDSIKNSVDEIKNKVVSADDIKNILPKDNSSEKKSEGMSQETVNTFAEAITKLSEVTPNLSQTIKDLGELNDKEKRQEVVLDNTQYKEITSAFGKDHNTIGTNVKNINDNVGKIQQEGLATKNVANGITAERMMQSISEFEGLVKEDETTVQFKELQKYSRTISKSGTRVLDIFNNYYGEVSEDMRNRIDKIKQTTDKYSAISENFEEFRSQQRKLRDTKTLYEQEYKNKPDPKDYQAQYEHYSRLAEAMRNLETQLTEYNEFGFKKRPNMIMAKVDSEGNPKLDAKTKQPITLDLGSKEQRAAQQQSTIESRDMYQAVNEFKTQYLELSKQFRSDYAEISKHFSDRAAGEYALKKDKEYVDVIARYNTEINKVSQMAANIRQSGNRVALDDKIGSEFNILETFTNDLQERLQQLNNVLSNYSVDVKTKNYSQRYISRINEIINPKDYQFDQNAEYGYRMGKASDNADIEELKAIRTELSNIANKYLDTLNKIQNGEIKNKRISTTNFNGDVEKTTLKNFVSKQLQKVQVNDGTVQWLLSKFGIYENVTDPLVKYELEEKNKQEQDKQEDKSKPEEKKQPEEKPAESPKKSVLEFTPEHLDAINGNTSQITSLTEVVTGLSQAIGVNTTAEEAQTQVIESKPFTGSETLDKSLGLKGEYAYKDIENVIGAVFKASKIDKDAAISGKYAESLENAVKISLKEIYSQSAKNISKANIGQILSDISAKTRTDDAKNNILATWTKSGVKQSETVSLDEEQVSQLITFLNKMQEFKADYEKPKVQQMQPKTAESGSSLISSIESNAKSLSQFADALKEMSQNGIKAILPEGTEFKTSMSQDYYQNINSISTQVGNILATSRNMLTSMEQYFSANTNYINNQDMLKDLQSVFLSITKGDKIKQPNLKSDVSLIYDYLSKISGYDKFKKQIGFNSNGTPEQRKDFTNKLSALGFDSYGIKIDRENNKFIADFGKIANTLDAYNKNTSDNKAFDELKTAIVNTSKIIAEYKNRLDNADAQKKQSEDARVQQYNSRVAAEQAKLIKNDNSERLAQELQKLEAQKDILVNGKKSQTGNTSKAINTITEKIAKKQQELDKINSAKQEALDKATKKVDEQIKKEQTPAIEKLVSTTNQTLGKINSILSQILTSIKTLSSTSQFPTKNEYDALTAVRGYIEQYIGSLNSKQNPTVSGLYDYIKASGNKQTNALLETEQGLDAFVKKINSLNLGDYGIKIDQSANKLVADFGKINHATASYEEGMKALGNILKSFKDANGLAGELKKNTQALVDNTAALKNLVNQTNGETKGIRNINIGVGIKDSQIEALKTKVEQIKTITAEVKPVRFITEGNADDLAMAYTALSNIRDLGTIPAVDVKFNVDKSTVADVANDIVKIKESIQGIQGSQVDIISAEALDRARQLAKTSSKIETISNAVQSAKNVSLTGFASKASLNNINSLIQLSDGLQNLQKIFQDFKPIEVISVSQPIALQNTLDLAKRVNEIKKEVTTDTSTVSIIAPEQAAQIKTAAQGVNSLTNAKKKSINIGVSVDESKLNAVNGKLDALKTKISEVGTVQVIDPNAATNIQSVINAVGNNSNSIKTTYQSIINIMNSIGDLQKKSEQLKSFKFEPVTSDGATNAKTLQDSLNSLKSQYAAKLKLEMDKASINQATKLGAVVNDFKAQVKSFDKTATNGVTVDTNAVNNLKKSLEQIKNTNLDAVSGNIKEISNGLGNIYSTQNQLRSIKFNPVTQTTVNNVKNLSAAMDALGNNKNKTVSLNISASDTDQIKTTLANIAGEISKVAKQHKISFAISNSKTVSEYVGKLQTIISEYKSQSSMVGDSIANGITIDTSGLKNAAEQIASIQKADVGSIVSALNDIATALSTIETKKSALTGISFPTLSEKTATNFSNFVKSLNELNGSKTAVNVSVDTNNITDVRTQLKTIISDLNALKGGAVISLAVKDERRSAKEYVSQMAEKLKSLNAAIERYEKVGTTLTNGQAIGINIDQNAIDSLSQLLDRKEEIKQLGDALKKLYRRDVIDTGAADRIDILYQKLPQIQEIATAIKDLPSSTVNLKELSGLNFDNLTQLTNAIKFINDNPNVKALAVSQDLYASMQEMANALTGFGGTFSSEITKLQTPFERLEELTRKVAENLNSAASSLADKDMSGMIKAQANAAQKQQRQQEQKQANTPEARAQAKMLADAITNQSKQLSRTDTFVNVQQIEYAKKLYGELIAEIQKPVPDEFSIINKKNEIQDTINTYKKYYVEIEKIKQIWSELFEIQANIGGRYTDEQAAKAQELYMRTSTGRYDTASIKQVIEQANEATVAIQQMKEALANPQTATAQESERQDIIKIEKEITNLSRLRQQLNTQAQRQKQSGYFADFDVVDGISGNIQSKVDTLSDIIKKLEAMKAAGITKIDLSESDKLDGFNDKVKKATELLETMRSRAQATTEAVNQTNLRQQYDNLAVSIQSYMDKNSKMTKDQTLVSNFKALQASLNQVISASQMSKENIKDLTQQFNALKAAVGAKGLTGKSLKDDIAFIAQKLGIKAMLGNSVYRVVGYVKQMFTTVKQLDTEMTALKRVTSETANVYESFLKGTTKMAKELGTTMTDVISSVTSFVKLGYDMQEAQTLASNAMIYKTVGDIDINTATNDMISTMKAFNLEASQSEHIVDAFDIINNKYAVSAQQVGEGLKGSAAALATANNTFEESAAM